MWSRRNIFIGISIIILLLFLYNLFTIITFYLFDFVNYTTQDHYIMKYHYFYELYGNISHPDRPTDYQNPPLKPYCRNDVLVRDFDKDPLILTVTPFTTQTYFLGWLMKSGENQAHMRHCEVNCIYNRHLNKENIKQTDGFFTFLESKTFPKVCRHQKNVFFGQEAWVKFNGFDIVGSTFPNSDVYATYSGWDILTKDPAPKIEKALASAFISNCYHVSSERNKIIEQLFQSGLQIDSYGNCHKNKEIPEHIKKNPNKSEQKLEIIKNYKFHLAFENSNEDGYITEKYWQSLYVGTIPIYLGAPDIKKYEPRPGSIINVLDYKNIVELVKDVKRIAENETLYNQMLEWKRIGPTDEFMARADQVCGNMYCFLCYKTADTFLKPIEFSDEDFTIVFIRERLKFRYRTIKLVSKTLKELHDKIMVVFKDYTPIWRYCWTKQLRERRGIVIDPPLLRIFRIIQSGLNYKDSLEGDSINSDEKVYKLKSGSRLEVIFV